MALGVDVRWHRGVQVHLKMLVCGLQKAENATD